MEEKFQKLIEGYPVWIDQYVAWGDQDPFQHVNNVVFFKYFENVRVEYGNKINIKEKMESDGLGPILSWTDCKYIRPLTHPDTAIVAARCSAIEGSRMHMEYIVVSRAQEAVVAVGGSTGVYYNYREFHKETFPDFLVERIRELEGHDIPVTDEEK